MYRLREWCVRWCERIRLARETRRRDATAYAFNVKHVVNERYDLCDRSIVPGDRDLLGFTVRGGYRWMCPTCNTIHAPIKHSFWIGLIYPSCCEHPEGVRHYNFAQSTSQGHAFWPKG